MAVKKTTVTKTKPKVKAIVSRWEVTVKTDDFLEFLGINSEDFEDEDVYPCIELSDIDGDTVVFEVYQG